MNSSTIEQQTPTSTPANTSLALNLCNVCGRAHPLISSELGEGLIEHHYIGVTGSVRRCKGSGKLHSANKEDNEQSPLPTYKQLVANIGDLVGKVKLKSKAVFVRKA